MFFFFFNDTATTEIYTLSLHDALPISDMPSLALSALGGVVGFPLLTALALQYVTDRKSTRLNSSHLVISYAVFCLKKKKNCKTFDYCSIAGQRNHFMVNLLHLLDSDTA